MSAHHRAAMPRGGFTGNRTMKRVAIYARYSSDLQRPTSIEDQLRICRERASVDRNSIVAEYQDAALSGETLMTRPGILQLLADARAGRFDIVLAEALDRLSRDQEHIAGLYKRLTHADVQIITLTEGVIDPLQIGFKGTMNQMALRDMAAKVRRGQRGQVERGHSAGGISYGYRVVRRFGTDGLPISGLREIDQDQAAVINRIFREYVAGKGPRIIARTLNAEGIPSPTGGLWHASAINGSAKRRNGVLHNDLYAGRVIYNRQTFRKDPDTGKRVPRINPESEWVTVEATALRIVDEELWQAAQATRRHYVQAPPSRKQRPKHMLAGLLRCGCCGASMVKASVTHIGCGRHRETGACDNGKTVKLALLENEVLDGIRCYLLAPEAVAAFIEEYRKNMAAKDAGAAGRRADLQRRIDRFTTQIKAIVRAIAEERDNEDMRDDMMRMDRERAALRAQLAAEDAPRPVTLHPNAAALYRARLADLRGVLADPVAREELARLLRNVVAEIRLTPDRAADEMLVEVIGDLGGMMSAPDPLRLAEPFAIQGIRCGNLLVAPAGFEPATQGL